VTTQQKIDLNASDIQNAVKSAEDELQNRGRVLLRASGTEPKIRVMVEGENQVQVKALAQKIADIVTQAAF
ncbi:MAG: phosphoglucosamine mutase, partial [Methylotenera sp.]|nr:phosphoglucosamine mutase [Methylotenera sp.]